MSRSTKPNQTSWLKPPWLKSKPIKSLHFKTQQWISVVMEWCPVGREDSCVSAGCGTFDLWPVSARWLQWAVSLALIRRSVPTTVTRGGEPNLPTFCRLKAPPPHTARAPPLQKKPIMSLASPLPRWGFCKGPAQRSAGRHTGPGAMLLNLTRGAKAQFLSKLLKGAELMSYRGRQRASRLSLGSTLNSWDAAEGEWSRVRHSM